MSVDNRIAIGYLAVAIPVFVGTVVAWRVDRGRSLDAMLDRLIPHATQPTGAVTGIAGPSVHSSYKYDQHGNLIITTGDTSVTVNEKGQEISATEPRGKVSTAIYDKDGQAIDPVPAGGKPTE